MDIHITMFQNQEPKYQVINLDEVKMDGELQIVMVLVAGGSGYYGGETNNVSGKSAGAGGSSYISGHDGCDSIAEESTIKNIIHTGQSIHYSGVKFKDTIMIDGAGYEWTTEKGIYTKMEDPLGNYVDGKAGNGYCQTECRAFGTAQPDRSSLPF